MVSISIKDDMRHSANDIASLIAKAMEEEGIKPTLRDSERRVIEYLDDSGRVRRGKKSVDGMLVISGTIDGALKRKSEIRCTIVTEPNLNVSGSIFGPDPDYCMRGSTTYSLAMRVNTILNYLGYSQTGKFRPYVEHRKITT